MKRRRFFHSPPPKPDKKKFESLLTIMKFSDGLRFEVCFGCSDNSSIPNMGLELADENGRRRIC